MPESDNAFGLTKEALQKIEAKYDLETEKECMEWIQAIIKEKFYTKTGANGVNELLKDGVILCKLMNGLTPNCIKKINVSKIAFKQMENINNFLQAANDYGVAPTELFQTVDLYENKNMTQVIQAVLAIGRKAQKHHFQGPVLGPKESDKCEREFTEEQLKQGDSIIGMQMGSNKGSNQSGMNFGKRRFILD